MIAAFEVSRCRHFAAAVLVDAVHQTEVLLPSRVYPDEQLFEGFEALVWLWSRESSAYFEAVGKDPVWGRQNLHLEYHSEFAIKVAEQKRPRLTEFYVSMGRYYARLKKSKLDRSTLYSFANRKIDEGVRVLKENCLEGIQDFEPSVTL